MNAPDSKFPQVKCCLWTLYCMQFNTVEQQGRELFLHQNQSVGQIEW